MLPKHPVVLAVAMSRLVHVPWSKYELRLGLELGGRVRVRVRARARIGARIGVKMRA